ncbi:MAG: DNA polymerase I [Planctomycetota bacterium]|nr:DNA polymerase I [Planctomycetota bacterium]
MSDNNDIFYVVDGHAQFFRAYYAIRGGMTSPTTNEPTHMVYGFVGMMMRLLREQRPTSLALVIDAAGDQRTFRSQIYAHYKANRTPPPLDFHGQVQRCLEFTKLLGVPVFAIEQVEADDVIATIARRVQREKSSMRMRIVSRDKDLSQLVDAQTTLFDPQTGIDLGPEQLFETKGVRADQVADMLALMGDTSDNIPGVPGIGPKTAAQLITTYGSIDGLLANLDALTPKRRDAIVAAQSTLALARQLVALKEDCQIDFSYDAARLDLNRANIPAILALLGVLGFGRLRGEVETLLTGKSSTAVMDTRTPAQTTSRAITPAPKVARRTSADDAADAPLFAALIDAEQSITTDGAAIALSHPVHSAEYSLARTAAEIQAVIVDARAASANGIRIAFDTETDSLNKVVARLCGVSLSWHKGQGVYIPTRSPDLSSHCSTTEALDLLRPLFEDATVGKVAHNAKFDIQVLRRHGVVVRGLVGDSMVASYVVDATRMSHSLDSLAQSQLDYTCVPIKDLIGSGDFQRTFDQVPIALAAPYAAEDADIALRLDQILTDRIDADGLGALYRNIEVPLIDVLAELEFNGILVDAPELEKQCLRLSATTEEFRNSIIALAPHAFNPDSPKQLAAVLFNAPTAQPPGLGLKASKKVQGGPSTGIEVLERLAGDPTVESELPTQMIEYRRLKKLVGTYLEALRHAIEPATGRIHASFHQTGTATGRLSSSDPNMQNIPIRSQVGRDIRRAFVAPPQYELLACDYSQIELRVLAHLANDPAMIAAFQAGIDIHTAVAAEVNGIDPSQVTDQQRSGAKMVNFGIIYGITPWGLARRLGAGTTPSRAREIIDGYRQRFSRIDAFLIQCVEEAKSQGFVTTLYGRRRAVPQVQSPNAGERSLGERMAINTVVQGTAADLIKIAMVNIHKELQSRFPNVRMLLQIHDELLFEVPSSELSAIQPWIVKHMESAANLRVPLRVESSHGVNWFDAS